MPFVRVTWLVFDAIIKLPLVTTRTASCNWPVHLFVCLFVCLSPKYKMQFFLNNKLFTAMVSIDDLQEVVHRFFKEPIIGPIKSKMAEIHHLENRHDVIFFLPRVVRFG